MPIRDGVLISADSSGRPRRDGELVPERQGLLSARIIAPPLVVFLRRSL